jgi:hypothetical protein
MDGERDIFWDEAELPKPTRDIERLKADMDAWGYCLLAEAIPGDQLVEIRARLEAQAEAEVVQGALDIPDRVNGPGI